MTCTLCLPLCSHSSPSPENIHFTAISVQIAFGCGQRSSSVIINHHKQFVCPYVRRALCTGPAPQDDANVALAQRDDDDIRTNRCAKQTTCAQHNTGYRPSGAPATHSNMQFRPKLKHEKKIALHSTSNEAEKKKLADLLNSLA